ncbi:MAG: hypothetical protein FJW20_17485 [Acidimicrobiia bacterium]|nr:hypothetical protein [Acidimicrobiia bacterium]
MIQTLEQVLQGVLDRLQHHITTYVPSLVAALIIMTGAWIVAVLARWLIHRIVKGLSIDKFLRQSGVAYMIDRSGRLRATNVVAETAYWGILVGGVLAGLSVFNTDLTTQIIQGFVFLLPKLFMAGLILLAGMWLGQFIGRSTLVWAVNEGLPSPRRIAAAVRVIIMFVAVVVAADHINFARNIFLAAFIILVGGAVLGASLAFGVGAGNSVRRYLDDRRESHDDKTPEPSLWSHL